MTSLEYKFSANDIISQGRTTQENIDAIKTWNINTRENGIPIIPDEFVTICLLSCSNDLDQTKETIENYFKVKKLCPIVFDDRRVDGEEFEGAIQTAAFVPIHWPEENTYVIYVKMLDTNYRNCDVEKQLKLGLMAIESTQWEYPPDKIIVVQDIQGVGLMHLTKMKLNVLKIFFKYIQEGLPLKLTAIHYVNSTYVLNKFMVIVKMFINPELYKKIHFHCGIVGLDQFIPKHYIPSNYNGELQSVEEIYKGSSIKRLKEMKHFWDAEEAMRKQCFNKNS